MEDNFNNVPQEPEVPQNEPQNVQTDTQQEQPTNEYQYSYGNNQYQQYQYDSNHVPEQERQEDTSVMSLGDWLITVLLLLVPCVGIIVYFVWAFSKNGNVNRRNYCRAYLIFWAITRVLIIVFGIIAGAAMAFGNGGYYYY